MTKQRPTSAKFVQTLLFLEEPQIILLQPTEFSLIIAIATKFGEGLFDNPYFGAEITTEQFSDFIAEKFDLRYLMERTKLRSWYFIDLPLSQAGSIPLYRYQPKQKIPERYLPDGGFFAREMTESVSKIEILKHSTEVFSIDGAWDLPEHLASMS